MTKLWLDPRRILAVKCKAAAYPETTHDVPADSFLLAAGLAPPPPTSPVDAAQSGIGVYF